MLNQHISALARLKIGTVASPGRAQREPQGYAGLTRALCDRAWGCRLTTYRKRFARAAPAPRAKRFKDLKNRVSKIRVFQRFAFQRFKESWTCVARQAWGTQISIYKTTSAGDHGWGRPAIQS